MNPGTFAGVARRTTVDGQRRETYVLTSSNAALPIPSWAQGGKGIVYVTGCGAGGGGSGSGGHSGASAIRHPIFITAAATTVGVVVGAPVAGGQGGHTELSIGGVNVLRLEGGLSGGGPYTISMAAPALWDATAGEWRRLIYANTTFNAGFAHTFGSWSLLRGLPNDGVNPAPSTFGASAGAATSVAGYGSGGANSFPGGPGFLILEFVEGK